jgi:uncharacterized membrane protein
MVLLTAGLSNLVTAQRGRDSATLSLLNSDATINPMPFVFIGLLVFSLLVLILWRKLNRKGIPYGAVLLLLLVAAAWVLIISRTAAPVEMGTSGIGETTLEQEMTTGQQQSGAQIPVEGGETIEIAPDQALLGWVSLVISIIVALLFLVTIAALIWLYVYVTPDEMPVEVDKPLTELAYQAKAAIQALRQGQSFSEVVLRCYADMEHVLVTTQGIRRGQTMTAREFEEQLIQLGLPAAAVQELTRLFETTRYSLYTPQEDEQMRAVNSLMAIVAACEAMSLTAVERREDEAIATISV